MPNSPPLGVTVPYNEVAHLFVDVPVPALGVGMASVMSKVDVDSHELVDHLHKDGGWPLVFIGSPHSPRSICILGKE